MTGPLFTCCCSGQNLEVVPNSSLPKLNSQQMDNFCQLFSLSPSWFKPSSYHSWRIPPASDFIFCGSARLILQNTVRFYRITLLSKSPAVTSQALEWNVEILTILCNTPHDLPASHRRSLVGCGPWGCYESDTTELLHFHFSLSHIGEGNGNPLQCSCLENPRDGGAWAAVCGVTQSRTRLK